MSNLLKTITASDSTLRGKKAVRVANKTQRAMVAGHDNIMTQIEEANEAVDAEYAILREGQGLDLNRVIRLRKEVADLTSEAKILSKEYEWAFGVEIKSLHTDNVDDFDDVVAETE